MPIRRWQISEADRRLIDRWVEQTGITVTDMPDLANLTGRGGKQVGFWVFWNVLRRHNKGSRGNGALAARWMLAQARKWQARARK